MFRSTQARVIIGTVIFVTYFALTVVGSFAFSLYAIDSSQRKWCTTLDLLTSQPVPKPSDPAGNQSREQNYQFYVDLVRLRDGFECGR